MHKMILALAAAGAVLTMPLSPLSAATVVDVDGFSNASLNGANAVSVALGAGSYKLSFTVGAFTAFSRFSSENGCDGAGGNCVLGFENSVRYTIGATTYTFGDGGASGGIGPITGGGYYDTAARSFANSGKYSAIFNLAAPGSVDFFIYDDILGDNRGGVSLSVAAVPEPASWAMLISGFGMVGFAARRRRAAAAA